MVMMTAMIQAAQPAADDQLFDLENVVLTPHITGSMYTECYRMAEYMSKEISPNNENAK